ncbi:MAG TPA: MFS transporter [Actinospica sp.]|nr:MFS transporter [Actinospica sp.]
MLGVSLSAFSLLIVALAQRDHQLGVVAWGEAGMSAGSACGGLAFGALRWRASNRLQLWLLPAAIGVSVAAAAFAGNLPVLIALACAQGLFVSPAVTMTYMVADESARAEHRTTARGLVNAAYNLGSATGSAAAGVLLGVFGLNWCFFLAGLPVVAVALTTAVRNAVGREARS